MTRPDLMASLPAWAQNPEGRALCEQIIAERPDWFLRRYDGHAYNGEQVYKGSTAGKLRRMHRDWLEAQLADRDARWERGEDVTYDSSPFHVEDGNKLIHRLLLETEQLTEVEHLGPGRIAA